MDKLLSLKPPMRQRPPQSSVPHTTNTHTLQRLVCLSVPFLFCLLNSRPPSQLPRSSGNLNQSVRGTLISLPECMRHSFSTGPVLAC